MGWNHPDISLEEMMKLIKGFVDILILASGYQSSGLLAHWDSDNIKRAFQWAIFIWVFRRLSSLDVYQESIEELDAALFEMTSHPSFPQELFRRQSSVSCISSIEEGVDIVSNAVRHSSWTESDCSLFREQMNHENLPDLVRADALVDVVTWNRWKSRALSYFIDKRTIRLVSGASLIFSGTNAQWGKVFGQLNFSEQSGNNDLHEAIELLLLGCIASRWNCIIEHLMSVSYDSVTISKQYHVLANSVFGLSQSFHQKEEIIKSKEGCILDYLMGLLGGQLHLLWKSSPSLAAVSLPSWSTLFRLYLCEIETQFKGNPSTMRCCSCIQDRTEHKDCELAERIWCLYIFHVCGSEMIHGACGA